MARIQSCGFELGNLAMEVDTVSGAPCTLNSDTNYVRGGAYSLKVLPATSNGYVSINVPTTLMDGGTEGLYVRFYLYIVTLPSANTYIHKNHSAAGATFGIYVRLNTDATISLHNVDDASAIGSASSALRLNQWYRVEAFMDWTNAAELKLDGAVVATTTTAHLADQNVQMRFGVGVDGTNVTSGEWYIDDIAINDKTGTVQTSYPGAGYIVRIGLDGAGDDAPDGGGSFADADEVPPDDADFYVHAATNDIADFNCQSAGSAGIGSSDVITLVQVGARVASVGGTCSYNPLVKSQSGGTIVHGTTTTLTSTSPNTFDDTASSKQYKLTQYTDPQAGGAWTVALLNTMQIGTRAPDATPDVRVYNTWALVEFTRQSSLPPVRQPYLHLFDR